MNSTTNTKIADWVKVNSNVSKVAAELGVSRPTVYKYMELYDDGMRDQLDEEVVAYFDKCLADDDSSTVLMMRAKLTDELKIIRVEMMKLENRIPYYLDRKAMLSNKIMFLRKKIETIKSESDKVDRLNEVELKSNLEMLVKEYGSLEDELADYSRRRAELERKLKCCADKLSRYDKTAPMFAESRKEVYPIKTACTIEGNRCMIIHNGKTDNPDYVFVLQLFGKIGNEYVFLREYRPECDSVDANGKTVGHKGRNYIIIDDVLLTAPLFYKIIGCDESVAEGSDDGAISEAYDEKNTSGMCELKQSR